MLKVTSWVAGFEPFSYQASFWQKSLLLQPCAKWSRTISKLETIHDGECQSILSSEFSLPLRVTTKNRVLSVSRYQNRWLLCLKDKEWILQSKYDKLSNGAKSAWLREHWVDQVACHVWLFKFFKITFHSNLASILGWIVFVSRYRSSAPSHAVCLTVSMRLLGGAPGIFWFSVWFSLSKAAP